MDDYAGRVLADRYRLPLPPADEYELTDTRAFDTYSGQEVLVRQIPLPEVVEAEVIDADGLPDGFTARGPRERGARSAARAGTRRPTDPTVRRAVEAAQAAASIPDHPRLDQVFDVFAEGGSLWIVSELVEARPLAALLAEKPLTPYRAAEVASDVLMALRVLHAHGWVHRNITARTVLVCDDGRVMLTGLAVGAAEEALCGYDPVPAPESDGNDGFGAGPGPSAGPAGTPARGGLELPGGRVPPSAQGGSGGDPEAARRAAIAARAAGGLAPAGADAAQEAGTSGAFAPKALESGGDVRAARAGAIAAYRAGARAAARVQQAQQGRRAALPGARSAPEGGPAPQANGSAQTHTSGEAASAPPGQIADPYGVGGAPWHGAAPRPGANGAAGLTSGQGGRTALPPGGTETGGAASGGAEFGGAPLDDGATQAGATQAGGAYGATAPGAPAPGLDTAPPAGVPGPAGPDPSAPPGAAPAPLPPGTAPPSRWDDLVAGSPTSRGPATPLAAERARQARMAVVGPVTERWAPEQAGPVHENWQLTPPVGPATDLWALGALLFRAVQGHAPYPEESTAELVQMVCAEPPAFAEECGPLRPVVESLLRQDPTERLDFEELRGWLRSLVRSAPEPDAGVHVIAAPPTDTSRLPVVRRRGELVRRRRAGLPATSPHGRHKRAKQDVKSPRRLGRTLLVLILLLLAAAIAYAVLFMPKAGENGAAGDRTGSAGDVGPAPTRSEQGASSQPRPDQTSPSAEESPGGSGSAGATESRTTGPDLPGGFTLRTDPEGFRIAVAKGWSRTPKNAWNQVVYAHGDFELIVVKGRDGAVTYGKDPMAYQRDTEHELQPYRSSSWATATGLRTVTVGTRTMAEGQFTWTDGGHELYVRNLAMLIDGRYHIVQVRGPESQRDEVTKLYEQASTTYQVTG
ncbi:protein kinase [Streptomyces sp. NPDC101225]|uniref:protein kinase n=1 Tax=Streptomyces sp. NPDC101225 TaxID=3366135 RepID=UPI0037F61103